MRSPPPVPPLRDDLRVKKLGGRIVVEDAVRRVRVPIDPVALKVMEILSEGPCLPDELAEAVQVPRIELFKRVDLLNRELMLETPRAADQLKVHAESQREDAASSPVAADAPLRFQGTLAHACVACGGCCHGTDVGPLKDDDVAKIREFDWSPFLPADVRPEDWIDEVPAESSPTGQAIRLTGRRHGRCVFLGDDKLCIIHKHKGSQQKPTICRQFPYTFTRTPDGIDVSFSTECRAWWKARSRATPPAGDAEQLGQIRALIAEGAPILQLPMPVPVTAGVDLDLATWTALRAAMIAKVEGATNFEGLVLAVVEPVRDALEALFSGYRESELFATRAAFAVPEPEAVDQTERCFAAIARLRGALAEGIDAIAQGMRTDDNAIDADRARRFGWALGEVLRGRRCEDLVPFSSDLEIWRDLALASLQAHEPARRGDLLSGLAILVMKLTTGRLLAGLLAETALRGRVAEQDAVDAMVLVTKIPRGSAFERLWSRQRRDLVTVYWHDAPTLVSGVAARPMPAWL